MSKKYQHAVRKVLFRLSVAAFFMFIVFGGADFVSSVTADRPEVTVNNDYYNNVMAYDRAVALTFDDGPHPEKTLQILEILKRQQVPATFFFVGSQALKHPDIVQTVADSGYEIGNHSYSHSRNVHSSADRVKYELDVTNKIIANITGEQTLLYRPPFLLDIGSDPVPDDERSAALDWILEAGYIPVGADIDSLDWDASSTDELITNVLNSAESGHIILLHDGTEGPYTLPALETLIVELKARDYRFTTVSEIVGLNSADEMMVTNDLARGMSDENTNGDVTRLQTYLLREGYFMHEPTGYFGEITAMALMSWQRGQQLESELGFVGPETRSRIAMMFEGDDRVVLPTVSHFSHPLVQPLEKASQNLLIDISAVTNQNIPLISKIIIAMVVLRLVMIFIMLMIKSLKKKEFKTHWSGGVSVIVPAYNEEENIAATIDSILQTRRRRLELLVVDDGSTDGTKKVVLKLQKKYPGKIHLITQKNSGKAAALNNGLRHARYGVSVAVDGDTIFTPDTINHLVRPLGDPTVGAVAGKIYATQPNSLISSFQYLEYVIAQNIDKLAFSAINAIGVVPGPVGAWRTKLLLELGGYSDDTLVEDKDMTLTVLAAGKRILYEPRAIALTETPFRMRDFVKQRSRWIFGTIQCTIKHKWHFLNPFSGSLGLVVMPNTLVYTLILPLLYPIMDILLFSWILFNRSNETLLLFGLFTAIDLIYALFGILGEKQKRKLILWLPLQRLFYRVVVYYVVVISLIRVIEGSGMLWNKVMKRGDASLEHFSIPDFDEALVTNEQVN